MILGRSTHAASACFVELDDAVTALWDARHRTGALGPLMQRPIVLNAHAFPRDVPPGAIVYQTENVGIQVANPRTLWPENEIWDISAESAKRYGGTYVPVGYHPSMRRFERAAVLDIDVAFCGSLNPRRLDVLQELGDRGLVVAVAGPNGPHGAKRDDMLARCKVALCMQFHEDGIYPVLRAAHLVANRVPFVSEHGAEKPEWAGDAVPYASLVDAVLAELDAPTGAEAARLLAFQAQPMVLP